MLPLPRFEIRRNRLTRRFRFNLVARNGQVTTSSQRYTSKQACQDGIDSVVMDADNAEVVDLT